MHLLLDKRLKIVNVVTTADISQKINLEAFNKYPHLQSSLELYKCGYVKDYTMTRHVSVFRNGKMISVGTKSISKSFAEIKKAVTILKKHKLAKTKAIKPIVRNIVGVVNFNQILPIEKLARTIPKSLYESEQFPGLICRFLSSVVALVFGSGKVVIVGSKSYEELNTTYFELAEKLNICN